MRDKNLIFILLFLIIIQFNYIFCYGELNDTEFEICYNILFPENHQNCTYLNDKFKSISCCYYNMTYPDNTTLCLPLSRNSKNSKGNVNVVLPIDIKLKGYFDCSLKYIDKKFLINYIFIILIFYL